MVENKAYWCPPKLRLKWKLPLLIFSFTIFECGVSIPWENFCMSFPILYFEYWRVFKRFLSICFIFLFSVCVCYHWIIQLLIHWKRYILFCEVCVSTLWIRPWSATIGHISAIENHCSEAKKWQFWVMSA